MIEFLTQTALSPSDFRLRGLMLFLLYQLSPPLREDTPNPDLRDFKYCSCGFHFANDCKLCNRFHFFGFSRIKIFNPDRSTVLNHNFQGAAHYIPAQFLAQIPQEPLLVYTRFIANLQPLFFVFDNLSEVFCCWCLFHDLNSYRNNPRHEMAGVCF